MPTNTDPGFTKSACDRYVPLLEDYVSGALSGSDAKRAADHLKSCHSCRAAFERVSAATRLLRAAHGDVNVPGDFGTKVMARIRAAERKNMAEAVGFWQSFVSFGWRFAATAALGLLALFTYDVHRSRQPQPNVAVLRPTVTRDFVVASEPMMAPANRDEALMMVADDDNGNH